MHRPPERREERLSGERAGRLLHKGFEDVPDATLDEIARLAALVCSTPIAAVSLIDAGRRRCAATSRLPAGGVSLEDVRTMLMDGPFFAEAALSATPVVVADTAADSRLAEHPFVVGPPAVRFYAGVPLMGEGGASLGVVCVLDTEPRLLSPDHLDALRSLASQVVGQREFRHQAARARSLLERLARDEQRLIDAQRLASVGSWEWDVATGEVAWSGEMYRLFDWPVGTAVDAAALLARIGAEEAEALRATIGWAWRNRADFEFEVRLPLPSSPPRQLAWRGQVIVGSDGRRAGIRGTARDVTEQRSAEHERKRAEAERDQLAAAQALFIAAAAHELRTPVTTLVGMASTLQQHRHSMSDDELDFAFGALGRQGERMSKLIGYLLDLARIDNSEDLVSMKVIRFDDVVGEALETAPPPLGVHVRTRLDPDLHVRAERVSLIQVLVNLLTNAYRYGGSSIDVDAVSHHAGVTVTVTDDGPGVAEEIVDRLFQPFTRAASGRALGGSGLGLAGAERTVRSFGGSIRYEPAQPAGSRFVIDLPVTD